jgi:hypothetical protein
MVSGRSGWFEKLTGFREEDYASTRAKLTVEGYRLTSLVNGKSYNTGQLELAPLSELRDRVNSADPLSGKSRVSTISVDVREMHRRPGIRRRSVSGPLPVQSAGNDRAK